MDLTCPDFTGRAVFAVRISAGTELSCDAFSLMPADNKGGWRADVVEAFHGSNRGLSAFPASVLRLSTIGGRGLDPSTSVFRARLSLGMGSSTTTREQPGLSGFAAG